MANAIACYMRCHASSLHVNQLLLQWPGITIHCEEQLGTLGEPEKGYACLVLNAASHLRTVTIEVTRVLKSMSMPTI